MDLEGFESIRRLLGELKLLTRSQNTELTYLKGIKAFLKYCGATNPDMLIEEMKNDTNTANEKFKGFVIDLASKSLAPKSVAAWAAGVRKFLSANGIPVSNVPIKVYTLHEDMLPTKEDLKKVLETASSKARVCLLILLSSGLRIGELYNLTIKDVNLDEDPAIIRVKAVSAKERKGRITFMSQQAKEALKAYLANRNLEELTPDSPLISADNGKPMSYQNLQYILNNAFKKVGKKVGKRYTLHAHTLRKWFKTQMISAGIPGPIVDRLMGHSRYLAEEYELYTESQLREWYLKGVTSLTI